MRRRGILSALAVAALAAVGLVVPTATARASASCTQVDCLRINQLQYVGTHNSYHVQGDPDLFSALQAFDPALAATLEYSHPPLALQFGAQRARQIELDVFADPQGGRYNDRHIMPVLGHPLDSGIADLRRPGLKVLHVQEVDFKSRCWTFVACLKQVKQWSDRHPNHLPIAIQVEVKDDVIPDPLNLGFVQPLPFDGAQLDEVDSEIRSVFTPSEMITPDDVRGSHASLDDAVRSGTGWPTVGESRGKVMFLLDNEGKRSLYLQGHPALAGRVLFTPSSPGQPDAAFIKDNDPLGNGGTEWQQIQQYVTQGYMVRTRADTDTIQARTGDTTMRDAAFRSGAQWVSTDYPVLSDNLFGSGYFAALPGGGVARCNPINGGRTCRVFDVSAP